MRQVFNLNIRMPKTGVFVLNNMHEVSWTTIEEFKIRGKKKVVFDFDPVFRWNVPGYPIQVFYRTYVTGKRWILANKVFDTREDLINSLK